MAVACAAFHPSVVRAAERTALGREPRRARWMDLPPDAAPPTPNVLVSGLLALNPAHLVDDCSSTALCLCNGHSRGAGDGGGNVNMAWLRRLLPAPLTPVPSEAELAERRDRLTRAIVMQHAEGSVLLGEGKFEIAGDLLADDPDEFGVDAR